MRYDLPTSDKFHAGDVVRLADEFPPMMDHFSGRGEIAVVMNSDMRGKQQSAQPKYTLFLQGRGESAWYDESLLTLADVTPEDMIAWQAEHERRVAEREEKLKGAIFWSPFTETLAEAVAKADRG